MGKIDTIRRAVEDLSPNDRERLREWLDTYASRLFDEAIERDANSGKLDKLLAEVRARHATGHNLMCRSDRARQRDPTQR
jgi:hypothetical protein